LDIGTVLNYLSKIERHNLRATHHFTTRIDERKSNIHPDTNEIFRIILNENPVGILKQDTDKFKLLYDFTDEYDLVIIMSIKNLDPIIINLITCFPENSKKRRREDASGL
jgi:hypothetical protein